MAGISTPALAAAVSEAGGLGALGIGASSANAARKMIQETRALTSRAFNVNLFCHAPARTNPSVDAAWIARTSALFARFGAAPPAHLNEIYPSFRSDDAMLAMLLDEQPALISFHFGLPEATQLKALRETGAVLIATATSMAEARAIEAAGIDGIVAQGWEAGGHRGMFDPSAEDARLSTEALTRALVAQVSLPVVAAGGVMDGTEIRRALSWGAVAAQLGTAFLACPEAASDAGYRARLSKGGETVMTAAISGRPARSLRNAFTDWGTNVAPHAIPDYPRAYDLGKALNAAAIAQGDTRFGAQWSGMGVEQLRSLPTDALMAALARELAEVV